jgi:hypothetical protein
MRVAIMQPTFLPWSGYFGLMQSVDMFVFLDSVQFDRRSWQQRNRIKTSSGPKWLTVPVHSKGKRTQLISDVEIDQESNFGRAHCKSVQVSYGKAPFFKELFPLFESLILKPQNYLVDLNLALIFFLKDQLGIDTETIRSSELQARGQKANLLAEICRELGGSVYISPPGSKEYLNQSGAFEAIGVDIKYFDYLHPQYPQPYGDFLPYTSTIDLLFNCGEKSSGFIMQASSSY